MILADFIQANQSSMISKKGGIAAKRPVTIGMSFKKLKDVVQDHIQMKPLLLNFGNLIRSIMLIKVLKRSKLE